MEGGYRDCPCWVHFGATIINKARSRSDAATAWPKACIFSVQSFISGVTIVKRESAPEDFWTVREANRETLRWDLGLSHHSRWPDLPNSVFITASIMLGSCRSDKTNKQTNKTSHFLTLLYSVEITPSWPHMNHWGTQLEEHIHRERWPWFTQEHRHPENKS